MTPNISECVEVNAHSLLLIMMHLKKENLPHLFLPWKFTSVNLSQSYEGLFRLFRSASSSSSTQTNFSLRSFAVDKGKNVDVSLRETAENIKDRVVYPTAKRPFDEQDNSDYIVHELPNQEVIEKTVLEAQANDEKNFPC